MKLCLSRTHMAGDSRMNQIWDSSVGILFFFHRWSHKHRAIIFSLPCLWHTSDMYVTSVISAQETAAKTKSIASKGLRLVDCVCGICLCVSVYAGLAPVRTCRGQRGPLGVLWSFSTLFPKTGSVTELEAAGEPQRSSFSTPYPASWGYGHACPCLTFHIHSEDPHTEAHTFEASALPHGTNSTVLITIFLNLVLLY